jgi:hypothetical protein
MKTTIETLTTAREINKEGRTFIEDCNATVVRYDNNPSFNKKIDFKFYATKHDYLFEHKSFKTFKGLWNYLYKK